MDENEKEQLIKRLEIVIQQRNAFLDQIVVLTEQLDTMSRKVKELENPQPKEEDLPEN